MNESPSKKNVDEWINY